MRERCNEDNTSIHMSVVEYLVVIRSRSTFIEIRIVIADRDVVSKVPACIEIYAALMIACNYKVVQLNT